MMPNYEFFIGSDISKAVIDVAYYEKGQPIYLGQFPNNQKGFTQVVKKLKRLTCVPISRWFFCFENTGVYSKPLLHWLFSNGIKCREENALKILRSIGIRRGKDDQVDSKVICRYAFEKKESIQPSVLAKPLITKLKDLLSRRELLVKHKVAIQCSLMDRDGVTDATLLDMFKSENKKLIDEFKRQIKSIEAEIKKLIETDDEVSKNYKLVQSVVGIGPIISSYFISLTGNFTNFNNPRKFATYSGVAPFPNQSGVKIGPRKVSHLANKRIKGLLSNAALSAVVHDREISRYYARKVEEGKAKGSVYNAVKNKLIQRVFAVVQRQTPYVKIMNYA